MDGVLLEVFQETASLTPELKQVLQDLPESVSPKYQGKIEQLFRQHRHMFASKEKPFGRTELVAHK